MKKNKPNEFFYIFQFFVALATVVVLVVAEPEAEPKPVADLWYYGGQYAYNGYGYYPRRYYGYHYLGKRSAEADPLAIANPEADANPWYHRYHSSRYPYYTEYYPPYRYAFGHHYVGKRSAKADPNAAASPEAKAEPWRYGWAHPRKGALHQDNTGSHYFVIHDHPDQVIDTQLDQDIDTLIDILIKETSSHPPVVHGYYEYPWRYSDGIYSGRYPYWW